jgi:hypothetical protein
MYKDDIQNLLRHPFPAPAVLTAPAAVVACTQLSLPKWRDECLRISTCSAEERYEWRQEQERLAIDLPFSPEARELRMNEIIAACRLPRKSVGSSLTASADLNDSLLCIHGVASHPTTIVFTLPHNVPDDPEHPQRAWRSRQQSQNGHYFRRYQSPMESNANWSKRWH